MTYNTLIQRTAGGSDALVPEPLSAQIIQEMPKHSAAMPLMRHMPLSSKTQRLPVLDVLPVAYFVATGIDTGLKQTAQQAWKNVSLVVEEIATIVPIPESYLADADVPVWDEVAPRMSEAAGALVDSAVFWGVNRPSTWGVDLWTAATGSGNVVKDGYLDNGGGTTQPADDFGQSVAALGDYMSQTGYTVNGFASRPGLAGGCPGCGRPRASRSTSRTSTRAARAASTATRCPRSTTGAGTRRRPRRSAVTGPRRSSASGPTSRSRSSPRASSRTTSAPSSST